MVNIGLQRDYRSLSKIVGWMHKYVKVVLVLLSTNLKRLSVLLYARFFMLWLTTSQLKCNLYLSQVLYIADSTRSRLVGGSM